jgi:hypothetical protein
LVFATLFENVGAGLIHPAQEAYTEYVDPKHNAWERKIRSALKKVSLSQTATQDFAPHRTFDPVSK